MAPQDPHARHEDHDTGSTHPSSRHRSRALREHHALDKVVSGCPPRYSIALDTGGPSDELIEGSK